jgi:protein tyrosine/serine phosphatase
MQTKTLKKYIVVILVLCAASLLYFYFFIDNRFYTVVEGKIYRSARLSDDDLEKYIREKDIKTILNLAGRRDDKDWYKKQKEIAETYNVQLRDIEISPNDLPEIDRIISIVNVLENSERPLLIHCRKGVDRTGLVSAIALAMEKDPSLDEVKKQFSLRYGVIPVYRSVGPYFFKQYEKWLKGTDKTHGKEILLSWITNDYVDNKGNLKFWIDSVNEKIFNNTTVHVENGTEELTVKGWAFDFKTKAPPEGSLYIKPDNSITSQAIFKYNRPGVAQYFDLGEKYYETFNVGWEAMFQKKDFSKGCHTLYLEYVQDDTTALNLDTDFKFCLN